MKKKQSYKSIRDSHYKKYKSFSDGLSTGNIGSQAWQAANPHFNRNILNSMTQMQTVNQPNGPTVQRPVAQPALPALPQAQNPYTGGSMAGALATTPMKKYSKGKKLKKSRKRK
jgi:hypothetical protein